MKMFRFVLLCAVLVGASFAFEGCNNDSSSGSGSGSGTNNVSGGNGSVPKIGGRWDGDYEIRGTELSPDHLTATIRQDGTQVTITTSLPTIGHILTGRIDEHGDLYLTDQFDGELWTSHEHHATSTYIEIEDFRRDISKDALAVITLHRAHQGNG